MQMETEAPSGPEKRREENGENVTNRTRESGKAS